MERSSVVVVGSINEDIIIRVDRWVDVGQTVLAAAPREYRPGGKGANQAVAAARAGAAVEIIGCVGRDATGESMLAALREAGVGTSGVMVKARAATGTAYCFVTAEGDNAIIVDAGANRLLGPGDVEHHRDAIGAAAVLVAQLEVPVDTVRRAVDIALQGGARPVVSIAPAEGAPADLLAGLDPVLVNEREAAALTGRADLGSDPGGAAARLLEMGARSVVVTLGARGALVVGPEGRQIVAARPVPSIVDSVGAGDAFAGALAAARHGGSPWPGQLKRVLTLPLSPWPALGPGDRADL